MCPATTTVLAACFVAVHCEVAGGWHLSEVEFFLRDQNDQTERKMETEKIRREERLVSDSLLCFFGKLGSIDTFIINIAQL